MRALRLLVALALLGLRAAVAAPDGETVRVRFQSDWFPQTEHGGYYQALQRGWFAGAGLAVEILPGGPGARPYMRVATGEADMGMGRSDDVILQVANGKLPLVIVGAEMQRDPQAILVHEDSPVRTFSDLDGRTIMATPAAAWVPYLQERFKIRFELVPLNFGLGNFLADPGFIQQCLVTNEPYFAAKKGARVRTLLIADSGYRPYRVILASRAFLKAHPEAVRAFVGAAQRGWHSFLHEDPQPALAEISRRAGERMPPDLMQWSRAELLRLRLVEGEPAAGEALGKLTRTRLQEQVETLASLKLIPAETKLESFADLSALTPE